MWTWNQLDVGRGPQGFDGGRATTTGTITIRSKRPSFMSEAYASVLIGQLDSLSIQGAIGGSVIDDLLAWRGTFYRNQREGAFASAYGPLEDRCSFGDVNRTYGRVQFLLTPFKNFEALLSLEFKPKGAEYVERHGRAYGLPESPTMPMAAPTMTGPRIRCA